VFGNCFNCKVTRKISQVKSVKELRDPDYGSTLSCFFFFFRVTSKLMLEPFPL